MSNSEDNVKAENSFLNELRIQFDREVDLRKSLDTKANSMITLTTTLITINLAIAGFLITKITDNFLIYYIAIGIFSLVIFFSVNAIWRLVKVYEIKEYDYPMGYRFFFDRDKFDDSSIEGVKNITESQFNDRMFKEYLSIRNHDRLNIEKANGVIQGQVWITRSLITIAILVGFVLSFGFNHYLELSKFVTILYQS